LAPRRLSRRHPSATLVAPNPGHCHEPGDLVPPDVVAGFLGGDDMSVWIPYLRSSPPGGRPGWGRGLRPRCSSRRVPARCLEVGVRVSGACGRWARRSSRCSEAGEGRCGRSLRPRRTPTLTSGSRSSGGAPGSLSITDSCGLTRGHPGIDPRRCRPLDPLRCDSAPKPSVLPAGEISPASFPVSAARWPTRRTACSFSPAVSLGDDGPFARASPVPLSRLCCHGSSPPPKVRPSRGTSRRQGTTSHTRTPIPSHASGPKPPRRSSRRCAAGALLSRRWPREARVIGWTHH